MVANIRVVEETETGTSEHGGLPLVAPQPSPPQFPQSEVIGAIHQLNGRLQAVESTIQGIPQAVGLLRALLRALGARALMVMALGGCLGLAGACAASPTWPGLAIFGAFSVLVYLPLAYLASKGN